MNVYRKEAKVNLLNHFYMVVMETGRIQFTVKSYKAFRFIDGKDFNIFSDIK